MEVAELVVGEKHIPQEFGHSEERQITNESIAETAKGMDEVIGERSRRQDEKQSFSVCGKPIVLRQALVRTLSK
jgi:hypothetical protein